MALDNSCSKVREGKSDLAGTCPGSYCVLEFQQGGDET
jgi:hypothetical protein